MSNEENFAKFGCYHTACGRVLSNRKTADRIDETNDKVAPSIDPVKHIIEGARGYAHLKGLGDPHEGVDYHKITQSADRIRQLGHAYDSLPNHDPQAVPHYEAMRHEVNNQYDHLTKRMGINVQSVDHDPYRNAHEMIHDLHNNKRLQVMKTSLTGHHPYFSDEDNDKFRAVHDAFGHAGTGRDFDRHGEEAAFHAHARMFSPEARGALATETRGQNGSLIKNGQFGPQKIALLPRHFWTPEGIKREAVHVLSYDPKKNNTWHHGTMRDIHEFSDETPSHNGSDWNNHLGTHFTTEKNVARDFGGRNTSETGRVFTGSLKMKNPKVYNSERTMTHEVMDHELAQGNHYDKHFLGDGYKVFGTTPIRAHQLDKDIQSGKTDPQNFDHRQRNTWMDSHPDIKGIAERHKDRLKEQGHDGIVYGNEIEGSKNHACAIPFSAKDQFTKKSTEERSSEDNAYKPGTSYTSSLLNDYYEHRRQQEERVEHHTGFPASDKSREEVKAFYGDPSVAQADHVEKKVNYKDWLVQNKGRGKSAQDPKVLSHDEGYALGDQHGFEHASHEHPDLIRHANEYEKAEARTSHPDHFQRGYSDGWGNAVEDHMSNHETQRIAVLVNRSADVADDLPRFMPYVAHVSGNSIDILHCPFCGSGAVIARSDATVECGYCMSVFTVQVQPAYNAFPQSVNGQDYPWPGAPDEGAVMAPDAPAGTNVAPDMDSSDPGDLEDSDDDIEDSEESGDDDGDDKPAFLKGKGDSSSDSKDSSDSKSKNDDDKGSKKGNPFAKKKSVFRTESGALLDEKAYIAHLAIKHADNPLIVAQAVKKTW